MPQLSQGDVFEAFNRAQHGLAIIFGHVGFNEMRQCWVAFSERYSTLRSVNDPFSDLANRAQQVGPRTWLWFVQEAENHGMYDDQLTTALDAALSWASTQGITLVITNGIANTDHGHNTALNRQSDNDRAQFLIRYAQAAERRFGVTIELISLNDVFVRNAQ